MTQQWAAKVATQKQEPRVLFDDGTVCLQFNGQIKFNPTMQAATVMFFPYQSLDPNRTANLKEELKSGLEYAIKNADRRAQYVQAYINQIVAPRAKMLWVVRDIVNSAKFDIPDVAPDKHDEAEKQLKAGIVSGFAFHIYNCDVPQDFTMHMGKIAQNTTQPWSANIARTYLAASTALNSKGADEFAKKEVALWLNQQGFANTAAAGEGNTLFSTDDVKNLAEEIRTGASARLANMDGLVQELRQQVIQRGGKFTMPAERQIVMDELFAISEKVNPDVAVLFDIALQDNRFPIFLFDGSHHKIANPYGGVLASYACYNPHNGTAFLPKKDIKPSQITVAQAAGQPLSGAFSIINHHPVTTTVTASKENAWREELLHRGFDRLFDNMTEPYPKTKDNEPNPMRDKFSAALINDVEHGSFYEELQGYIGRLKVDSAKALVPHLTRGSQHFNPRLFHIVATETIAKITNTVIEKGWDEATKEAPDVTKYLKEEVLPYARKRCTELGVQLTEHKNIPERLKAKEIPFDAAPETGTGNSGLSAL